MNLPIRWAVVNELRTGRKCIMAKLVHNGRLYETANIPPEGSTPAFLWVIVAAMTADFTNSVR